MTFQITEATSVLSRTPNILTAWLADLPPAWLHANEGPNTWNAYEVVGHLIHGERTDWIPRARHILSEDHQQPFEPFDRFAMLRQPHASIETLVQTFDQLRRDNIRALHALPLTEENLRREGMHPDLGPVTLSQLLATWVAHDLSHLAQIARVMARRYHSAVGPWAHYLGVLSRPV